MINENIALIHYIFSLYGAWGFFLLGFAEEVVFFIPSTVLFLALGFFAIHPLFTVSQAFGYAFGPIAFAGSAGVTLGAFCMYVLAYFGGKPFIFRFGRYVGVTWIEVENARRFFSRGYADDVLLVILRAVPIFPISVISIACGALRIRPLSFIVTTFAGSLVRIGGLSLLGWFAGREFFVYAQRIAFLEQIIVVLGTSALLVFICIRLRKLATRRR